MRDKGDGRQGSCLGKWRVRGKEGTGKGKGGRRKGGGDVSRGREGDVLPHSSLYKLAPMHMPLTESKLLN